MKILFNKIYILSGILLISLILLNVELTLAQEADLSGSGFYEDYRVIPPEPKEYDDDEVDSFLDRETGMYFRLFDLNEGGKVNYMTARRTNSSYMNEFWNSVIYKFHHPLFYWIDINGNGRFEPEQGEMWIDSDEDGLNGNEHIYTP